MADVHQILEETAPESRGVEVQWIGGAYRHTVEDVESIAQDLRWTAGVSLLLVFSLIGFAFRDWRAVATIFGPLFVSNIWTLGFASVVVGTLNTFTSFFMAVLIGLGVDFRFTYTAGTRRSAQAGMTSMARSSRPGTRRAPLCGGCPDIQCGLSRALDG